MPKNTLTSTLIPIDGVPINIAIYRYVDGEFIFVDINDTAQNTDSVKKEELVGKPLIEMFPGIEELGLIDAMLRVHENGGQEDVALGFYEDSRMNGWRHNSVSRLPNGDILVFYKDLTQQQETEEELQALGNIVDNSMSEVYIFDADNIRFTYVNKEVQRNTGYTLEEMKNLTPVDIKPDFDIQKFMHLVKPLLDGSQESLVFETIHRRKNGQNYNVEIRLQLMNIKDKKQFVVMANDISKRIQVEETLHKLATIDSLTGAFNRHQINEELDIEIERESRYDGRFSLVMMDLDYFKNINDTYGHDIGDYVLKGFSSLILNEIRECDRFGRWGGEEFILILPELNEEQAIQVAEKLKEKVSSHVFKDIPRVTISIGVTKYNTDDSKKTLLKRVDDAMYQAKKAGRNTVKYN